MCLNPRKFIDKAGFERTVGCRTCERCIEARTRDWVGRVCAETLHSVGATFFTLTYGTSNRYGSSDDVSGSAVLNYYHVQKWVRKLRDAGYPCRYFVAGEYGDKKGRAHWHVCCWWTSKVPERPVHSVKEVAGKIKQTCWKDPWWPHGNTQWGEVDGKSARYMCKYVTAGPKESDPAKKWRSQGKVRMSLKPLIGAKHFEEWARLHVEARLPIKDRNYTVNNARDPKTGLLWQYRMGDAPLRYVIYHYLRMWNERYPGEYYPHSELVERWADEWGVLVANEQGRIVPKKRDDARKDGSMPAPPSWADIKPPKRYGQLRKPQRPHKPAPDGYVQSFNEARKLWVAERKNGDVIERLFWSVGAWRDTYANELEWGSDRVRASRAKPKGRRNSWMAKKDDRMPDATPPPGEPDRSMYRPETVPVSRSDFRFGKPPKKETAKARKERLEAAAYDAAMLQTTVGRIFKARKGRGS